MKVNELIEELESCDGDREVYKVGVGGDFEPVRGVDADVSHEKLSVIPYKDENFVWVR